VRYSGTERDDDEPWFRIGTVDVGTVVLILLLWCVTLVVYTADGLTKPSMVWLALIPDDVVHGEVWRLVTWPWAHLSFQLGDIIAAVIFGFFGIQLERLIGRKAITSLLAWSIIIISLSATVWSQAIGEPAGIADLELLELTVILLFIAEYPKISFFFNIPAWAIGGVIVALELVNDLADRQWVRLLTVLVAAFLIAVVARSLGLLAAYERIPEVRLPRRKAKAQGGPSVASSSRSAGRKAPKSSKRPGSLWGKKQDEPAEIVEMPTQPRRRPVQATTVPDVSADDLALDLLLDKIADGGLDSLTVDERQQLEELRARRRGSKS
jgi:membrane associated rhomboid family serine protease